MQSDRFLAANLEQPEAEAVAQNGILEPLLTLIRLDVISAPRAATRRQRLVSGFRMFDTRWMLFLFACLALGVQPACVTVSKKLPPKEQSPPPMPIPQPPGKDASAGNNTNFAELPRLTPGQRIPRHPDSIITGQPKTDLAATSTSASIGPEAPPPPTGGPVSPVNHTPGPFLQVPDVRIDPPLIAALRAFLENEPAKALEALKHLEKANQEFVLAAMPALARGAQMNMSQADPQEVAVLTEQLQAAAARLEPQAALRVDKFTFCRKVHGFGRYDPWPMEQAFSASDLAELYLEIRHLRCEATTATTGGEGFVTRLVSSLEIRDAAGRLVDQTDPADWRRRVPMARFERTDSSRSPVRDYFLKYRFPVPSTPGTYTVTIEVRDVASSRIARSQALEFRVQP